MSSAATSHVPIERPASIYCIANCRLVKRSIVKLLLVIAFSGLFETCVAVRLGAKGGILDNRLTRTLF